MDSHTSVPVNAETGSKEESELLETSEHDGDLKDNSEDCSDEVIVQEITVDDDEEEVENELAETSKHDGAMKDNSQSRGRAATVQEIPVVEDEEEIKEMDSALRNMSPLSRQGDEVQRAHGQASNAPFSLLCTPPSFFRCKNRIAKWSYEYPIDYSPYSTQENSMPRNWQDKKSAFSNDAGRCESGDNVLQDGKEDTSYVQNPSRWFMKKKEARPVEGLPLRPKRSSEKGVGHELNSHTFQRQSSPKRSNASPDEVKKGADRTDSKKKGAKSTQNNMNYDGAGDDFVPFPDVPPTSSADSLEWSSDDEPLGSEEGDLAREEYLDEEEQADEAAEKGLAFKMTKPYIPPRPSHRFLTDDNGNMYEFLCLVRKGNGQVRRKFKAFDPSRSDKRSAKGQLEANSGQNLGARPPEWPPLGIDPEEHYRQSQPPEGRKPWMWKRDQTRFWASRGFNAEEQKAIIVKGEAPDTVRNNRGAGNNNASENCVEEDSKRRQTPEPESSRKRGIVTATSEINPQPLHNLDQYAVP